MTTYSVPKRKNAGDNDSRSHSHLHLPDLVLLSVLLDAPMQASKETSYQGYRHNKKTEVKNRIRNNIGVL